MSESRDLGLTEPHSSQGGSRDDRLAEVLGGYVNRLAAGEKLDHAEIRKAHPEIGDDLLRELQTLENFGMAIQGHDAPSSIGEYRILRLLGRGGMGVVYEAIQSTLERRVALKVLPSSLLSEPRSVTRFLNEARIAGKLDHPNIVAVHGMGIEKGVPFFAMEYVEGETLSQMLEKMSVGRNSPGAEVDQIYSLKIAGIFADAGEGLQYAHSKGVIHRDLKPSNLILDRAGRLRILDFGLARIEGQESITRSGEFFGTPLYMSPEQVLARRVTIDHRTDIYSLGASLYEMLALRPPFVGKTHQDTLSQIMFREPAPLRRSNPRIPRDLEVVVMKCLEKDPAGRYGTAEALAQDLRRFVRGDPIEARPLAAWQKLARRARRHRWLIAGAACLLLLALTSSLLLRSGFQEARLAREKSYNEKVLEAVRLLQYGQVKESRWNAASPTGGAGEKERRRPGAGVAFALDAQDVPEAPDLGPNPIGEARKLLEDAVALVPGRPDARFHLAKALKAQGKTEDARRTLAPLLAGGRPFLPAKLWDTAVLEKKGGWSEVLASFRSSSSQDTAGWEESYLRAQQAQSSRDWQHAAEAYTALIDWFLTLGDPYLGASIEARLSRGNAWLRLERYDGALEDFGAAQALAPGALEPLLLLVKTYCMKGDLVTAEARFESFFSSTPLKDEAARLMAVLFGEFAEHEKALAWAGRIEDEFLREQGMAWPLVRILRTDEALHAAQRAVELKPGDAWAHFTLAMVRSNREEREEALRSFDRAIEIDSTASEFLVGRSDILHKLVRKDEAFRELERALEIDPTNEGAHSSIAWLLRNKDMLTEAESHAREALAINPRSTRAHNVLAIVLDSEKKEEEAIAEYKRAITIDPTVGITHTNLGWLYMKLNRFEEGIVECMENLKLSPLDSEPHKILGGIYMKQRKLKDAEAEYRKFVEEEPLVGLGQHNLAVCIEQQGRLEEAVAAYRGAHRLTPDDVRFPYNLGNTLRDLGRLEESVQAFNEALKIEPHHGWALNNIAEVELKLGRTDDARQHFQLAIIHDPESPDAHWGLAVIFEKDGKPAEADAELKKGNALSKEPPKAMEKLREDYLAGEKR